MFIDARSISNDTVLDADVCVIGGGAAGITIATEFTGHAARVILLESGGHEWDERTQALYDGAVLGESYSALAAARLRYLGGSTNHWAGQCRPFDDIDFAVRSWVPGSGWPFDREHLLPYYRRAHAVCRLGAFDYDPASWETSEDVRLPLDESRVQTLISRVAPTRFGPAYREQIEAAQNICTCLHANAVGIDVNEASTAVTRVRVRTFAGNTFSVAARTFVLATGGIENARLLLASTAQPNGIGNAHGLVGRYFMEHTSVASGIFVPSDPDWQLGIYASPTDHPETGDEGFAYLSLPPHVQERERLLNMRMRLRPARWLEALEAINAGVNAARARDLDTAQRMRRVIAEIDSLGTYGYRRLFRPPPEVFWLDVQTEQAPNRDSRVVLSEQRDELGVPRADLHWEVGDMDVFTYRRASELIAEELGRAGVGRFRRVAMNPQTGWPYARDGLRWGYHHMGTTRMHTDPRRGVVDADCRVHGIANLYVAGSSVFPTGGHANPTLTIVALAIRLTDTIKATLT